MVSRKGLRYTGKIAAQRVKQRQLRETHKQSIREGSFEENMPPPMAPSLFSDIAASYWHCLASVKEPKPMSLYSIMFVTLYGHPSLSPIGSMSPSHAVFNSLKIIPNTTLYK